MIHNSVFLSVYNASAGSGKTTTLVKELLRLLLSLDSDVLDVKRVRQVLGLTFTNAVADELKKRLVDVLYEAAFKDFNKYKSIYFSNTKVSEEEIKNRSKQILFYILHHYSDLSLQTIDSFSNRVLKSFAYELNYSIAYEINNNLDMYYEKTIENYLDSIDSTNSEKFKLILNYISSQAEENENKFNFKYLSGELVHVLKSLVEKESGVEVLKVMKEKINQISLGEFLNFYGESANLLNNEINEFDKKIKKNLERHFNIENNVIKQDQPIDGRLIEGLNDLYTEPFNHFRSRYLDRKSKKFFNGDKRKDEEFVSDINQYEDEFIKLEKHWKKLYLFKTLCDKILITRFVLELTEILNDLKKEDDVVFFSDFTKEISKIIQNEENVEFIYERVGTRYRNFLIDEFQDTSTLQFHNLLPLIHNSMASGHENFIVGDPKQSIYKWRNANVLQFVSLFKNKDISFKKLKHEWEKFKNHIQTLSLNYNYRSAKEIVEFNNLIFNNLEFKDIQIIKDVYADSAQNVTNNKSGYVEIIEFNCKKNGIFSNKEMRFSKFREEVLKIISSCIKNAYQQKDICILLRRNEDINDLIVQLRGKKISENEELQFISSEGLLIYHSKDVDFIVAFMSLLLDRKDTVASGICWNYVNKKDCRKDEYTYTDNFNQNFYSYYENDAEFKKLFSNYEVCKQDLSQWCLGIIQYFDVPQNAAVQKFLSIVNKFIYQYALQGNTVENFLNFWEKHKTTFKISLSNDLNAVKVMTIHSSKGLEFPVVITYLNFKRKDNKYWYYIPDDFTIDLKEKNKITAFQGNYFYLDLKQIQEINSADAQSIESEEHLENINTIYVAFTRAIEQMYIFADDNNEYYKECIKNKIEKFKLNDEGPPSGLVRYVFGKKVQKQNNEKQLSNKDELVIDESIQLKKNNNVLLANNFNPYSDAINIGIKVHKVLEFLNDDNIDFVIKKALAKGLIREREQESIKKILYQIVESEALKPYFKKNNCKYVLSENEIFNGEGKIYRPDKILIAKDNKIIVLEFKTGDKKDNHQIQIKNYLNTLKNIFKSDSTMGYLIYLKSEEAGIELVKVE